MMKQGTDVSKAENNASGDGLTGVAAAEQSISITHCPVCTVLLEFTYCPLCTHNMMKLIQAFLKLCMPDTSRITGTWVHHQPNYTAETAHILLGSNTCLLI